MIDITKITDVKFIYNNNGAHDYNQPLSSYSTIGVRFKYDGYEYGGWEQINQQEETDIAKVSTKLLEIFLSQLQHVDKEKECLENLGEK